MKGRFASARSKPEARRDMGKFEAMMVRTILVGTIAAGAFFYIFPHPDKTTIAIAIGVIVLATIPSAIKLWLDLKR